MSTLNFCQKEDLTPREKKEITKVISKSKKENKIKVDYKQVETVVQQLIEKYDLDVEIETFIMLKLESSINHKEVIYNSKQTSSANIKYQFGKEFFDEIFAYVDSQFKAAVDKELHNSTEEKTLIFGTIFDNIELTMYETGLYKPKLISIHYIMKCSEKIAKTILTNNGINKVRGYMIPIEIFKFELLDIIGQDDDLTKFLVTLKSLVDNTLVKYNNKTKIGQFYYNVMMTTPNQIVEKIIRALIFTSLKNKNPATLRTIFSTYVTLIHKNIFTHYGTKLTNIKTGHFKALDDLFELSFIEDTNNLNPYQSSANELMKVYLIKNKRYFKENYELIEDEYINNFIDINYFDLIYSYKEDIPILDYSFYYNRFLKLTKNSFRSQSFYYKLNNKFVNFKYNKEMIIYITDKVESELFYPLMKIFHDKDTVFEITKFLTETLIEKVNPKNMIDKNFDRLHITFDNYLNYIIQIIKNMKKLI